MTLHKNVGTRDAYIRIAVSIFLLLLAIVVTEHPIAKILLATVSAILAGTASLHYCPLYSLLGTNTCGAQNTSEEKGSEYEKIHTEEMGSDMTKESFSEERHE